MTAQAGNPLEPLPYAPSFRAEGYEIKPGTERRWRGMSERVYTDRDGWFEHPAIARPAPVLSIWFFDGPMVEVTDLDLAPHDERDGYGCLTTESGLPPATQ